MQRTDELLLESSRAWTNFVNAINSPVTRVYQTNDLKRFMKVIQISDPDELAKISKEPLEDLLRNYATERQKKVRSQSVAKELSSLWKFFGANRRNKEIDWDLVRANLKAPVKAVKDRAYSREEIARLLKFSDLRTRVAVLLMASSGIRVGAVPSLQIKHLHSVDQFYSITVYERSPEEYVTFCTPECRQAIDAYLEFRSKIGGEVLDGNSPLIREQFDPLDKDKANAPQATTQGSIALLVRACAIRSGLRTIGKDRSARKEVMLNHGFRKFFKRNARKAGVDPILLEHLMGHRSGNLKEGISRLMLTYDPSEPGELLSEYRKAVQSLTINEEHRLQVELIQKQAEIQKKDELVAKYESLTLEVRNYSEWATKKMQDQQKQIDELEKARNS